MTTHPGRAALIAWEASKPTNFYDADPLLGRLLQRLAAERCDEAAIRAFGAAAATTVDAAAKLNDRLHNHPRLDRFDGIGVPTEGIEFHPSYHEAGRAAYEAGIVSCLGEPGRIVHQSALFYLLSHCGEAGHACPITCTSGMVRALQQKGDDDLRQAWLPGLLERNYETKLWGSQFLTEVQGGSDVGAAIVRAAADPDEPGVYRITGEKWFCSVADAPLYLVVARPDGAPEGTAGLGCFLVPRHNADGSPNGFTLRRLKDKIGTRTMASGEIDFLDARAWAIGPLDEGFKTAVGIVLNCSRLMNAFGSTGAMRRAYLEALSYAAHREAFGQAIGRYPLVRETLAQMKANTAAALVSSMAVADLVDRMDLGEASDEDVRWHRLLVNANKYWTSIAGTDVVHRGIEVLGGNGTIESFSVLPRLYRDSIVLESWEGAHNVLCMQVLRDAVKLDLFAVADRRLRAGLDAARAVDPELADAVAAVWRDGHAELDRCAADPMGHGTLHIKRGVERLMQCTQVVLLLEQAQWEQHAGLDTEIAAAAGWLYRRYLDRGYDPAADPDYLARIDAVLHDDLRPFAGARA